MTQPDFSGIAPARLAEIRNRIRHVEHYLSGPRTATRREAAAEELGVTPGQFLRVARIWRETRDPARLHGAGAPGKARKPSRALAPDTEATIPAAIDDLGSDVKFSTLLAEVECRCEAAGVAKPSGSTVYDRLNRRRSATGGATADPPSISIVRCSLRYPVVHQGRLARPNALLAVLMPGFVVAAEIGLDGVRDPDLPRLVRRLVRLSTAGGVALPVLAEPSLLRGDGETASVGGMALRPAPGVGSIVSRVFGRRLGDIAIRKISLSDRTFRERASARLNAPLALPDATVHLLRAIEAHNAGRSATPPPGFALARA